MLFQPMDSITICSAKWNWVHECMNKTQKVHYFLKKVNLESISNIKHSFLWEYFRKKRLRADMYYKRLNWRYWILYFTCREFFTRYMLFITVHYLKGMQTHNCRMVFWRHKDSQPQTSKELNLQRVHMLCGLDNYLSSRTGQHLSKIHFSPTW